MDADDEQKHAADLLIVYKGLLLPFIVLIPIGTYVFFPKVAFFLNLLGAIILSILYVCIFRPKKRPNRVGISYYEKKEALKKLCIIYFGINATQLVFNVLGPNYLFFPIVLCLIFI